jgi:hypothetical protein
MGERRAVPRHRTFKGGTIAFNRHFSTVDCLVRNLTAKGALLRVASSTGIPARFDLKLEHEDYRPCRVIWRHPDAIGIVFE